MKMRSWSESSGAMLVPSTFTGWYRNTIMTSASPMAMNRSRVHTRISLRRVFEAEAESGAGAAGEFTGPGSEERTSPGLSGEVEVPRCFWSERSILGTCLFIAWASRCAPVAISHFTQQSVERDGALLFL